MSDPVAPAKRLFYMQYLERRREAQSIDFMPALIVIVALFVALAVLDFTQSWPAAERGLLLFEKACPLYHSALVAR